MLNSEYGNNSCHLTYHLSFLYVSTQYVNLMKELRKIIILSITTIIIAHVSLAQSVGDFRTRDSGKWTGNKVWQIYNGTTWVNTNSSPDDPNADITIMHYVEFHTTGNAPGYSTNNLIIDASGKLYRNKQQINQAKAIQVYGNVVCDGVIGNGATKDRLNLDVMGSNCTISGSGECKFNSITKSVPGNSYLFLDMDIELYITATEGDAITNSSGTTMNITINPTRNLTSHSNINLLNCNLEVKCNTLSEYASLITESVSNSTVSNTTVERFIEENAWHYISCPVDDANTVIFLDTYLEWFNEPDSVWTYIFNADTILATDMQGYANWSSTQLIGNTTLEFKGELNAGPKSISLTNTQTAGHNSKGFNFTGNPYTSALDWDYSGTNGWTKTNVDNAIYIWNSLNGSYGSYINGVNTNDVTNIIPAQQGFFVHCNSPTGLLGVDFGAQVHNHKPFMKSSIQLNPSSVKFTTTGNGYKDETILNCNEFSTMSFDGSLDAYKLMGLVEAPQIFSISEEGDYLSINTLPIDENSIVKLGFNVGLPGYYTLMWEGINDFDQNLNIYLEDLLTGSIINLGTESDYQFSYDFDQADHRFNLHFELPNEVNSFEQSIFTIYSSDDYIYVKLLESETADISIFNILGQNILSQNINDLVEHKFFMKEGGYYIVNIISNNYNQTVKVFVK